ncbi:OmpH family outer membrane protein [Spirosoma sp. KCTC 42546]|uniref:OmpH family outer membrane protein n=1 Tax=Spirosoma sp. KCTC 42546 TaxID=2520506 RepID=UPI001158B52D|nr:OmpH family outer membrane protein [Spirosoma sp. KCTC 42546]QDK78047.1 OmpH family outer membrane protein [Spirosoma sp. KCTC 42546]
MKKALFFVLLCSVWVTIPAQAQKFGYIDTEYIFGKMPEYQKALSEIDKFADKWSKDIQDKYVDIEKLQKAYQAEEILLTEDMKRERQRIISDKEREARDYNNKVFGYQGLLFEKKKELMKAPMELINRAVEKICIQKKLDFIFDKASDFVMLYTNPRHDYSDYVMEELGLDTKPTATNSNPTNKTTTKPK